MSSTKVKSPNELPDLDGFMDISAKQAKDFREKGHTLISNILSSEEVAIYRQVINDAVEKYNMEKRNIKDRDTYGKAFLQIENIWLHDEKVEKFVLAKRFGKIAADLLGVENVRIYHDQALFKEPGGGPTPWHQDQYYWPVDTTNTITMWMPLVDISLDMGMLTFASNSQKRGIVFDYEISDKSEEEYEKYVKENGFPIFQPSTMQAGDATWHYGNTIHCAPGNKSDFMREIMTIIYVADGARVVQPTNEGQEVDHKGCLMNVPIGEYVSSEKNPTVL